MYKFGIIGLGKMGSALLNGVLKSQIYKKEEILLSAHSEEKKKYYLENGFNVIQDNVSLIEQCEIILLAIKPQIYWTIKDALSNDYKNKCFISIMAGISLKELNNTFIRASIYRAMPNTPCLINKGTTTICALKNDDFLPSISNIFNSCGTSYFIKEENMDMTLALNGSMPAYIDYFIKGFLESAIKNGLDEKLAKNLLLDSISGSVELIRQSKDNIDTLINNVCSKGGTTIAGLNKLEENNFLKAIDECYEACKIRSIELAKK